MSNAGQAALIIIGAVAGYFLGPAGSGATYALLGAALGSAAGQALFPTVLPPTTGPHIGDKQTTTSALGDPVIIGYGTFMSSGTVNFLGELIETPTTTTQGGSGGPVQTSTTFSYTQSIGIGLCETTSMNGVNVPIIGIQRAWENGELVYDTRAQQPGESDADYTKRVAYSVKYAGTFVLYLGTEDQEPDPTIELQQGANAPFFRGIAYVVYPDRVLRSDQGIRHPTFKFEILKAATFAPEVIFPTFLTGAHNASLQINMLASDLTNGRYYVFDGSGAILGFNMLNNTQFAENDALPEYASLGGVSLAVAPDGFLLATWFNSGSTAVIVRLDPLTLALAGGPASYDPYGVDWQSYATATVNFGMGPTYILAAVGLLKHINLTDCVSLTNIATYAFTNSPSIAAAPNESGSAVFWVISNTPSSGPTGGNVAVNKLTVGTGSVAVNVVTHTFAPAEFDPLWTWVGGIGDMLVDPSDGHVMFRVTGNGSGATNTAYILKFNGNTGVIDWTTPVSTGPNYNYATSQNQIANNTWWLADNPPGLSGYYRINVVTGDITVVSLSSMGAGSQVGATVTASCLSGGAILAPLTGGPPGSSPGWTLLLPEAATPGKVLISDIVADLCARSNAPHDTSAMGTETVDGYMIASTPMTGRDAMVPLRSVGFFDSCETGDTIRFVRRGGAPALTLVTTDLGAYETGTSTDPAPANAVATQMESDLPFQLRLSYTSPSRDYQPGQQLSLPRFDTMSDQLTDVQLGGVCLDDDQAIQVAEILWNDAWASDHTYTFAVDQSKAALEPTDVVLVPMVDTLMRVRIVSIDDASQILRSLTAVSDDDGNYVSSAIAAPVPYKVTMRFYAGSALILIDAPLLLDSNDTGRTSAPLYSVVYPTNTDTWTGAAVLESNDSGATFTNVATATGAPATGQATTALGDVANPFLTDVTNSVTVKMQPGSTLPASVTTAQLLNGANGAALINADGSVEIFQFRDVAVVSSDTVTLSYLLRGRRGSDEMTGGHSIGNRFVMLNVPGTVQKTNIAITDLNSSLLWKAVGSRDTIASVPTVPFTTIGRSLMPRAPWNTRTSLSGSDILIDADRRSRIENDTSISFASPTLALNEDSEAYQVDVYSGSSLVRTLSGTALPITYPAAAVTADFGSTPATLKLAVYQMSGEVGRGFTHLVTVGVPT
jgi:hypothetical protein